MVKNGYYGNEGFGLPWDRIKLSQINLFTTTIQDSKLSHINTRKDLKISKTGLIGMVDRWVLVQENNIDRLGCGTI